MNTVIYKPFKRNASSWALDTESTITNSSGRRSFLVKIGVQQIADSDTGEVLDTTPITEYVYEDILRKIFTDCEEYSVRTNLGYEPQLVITYENRLVLHNDEISGMVEKIRDVIKEYDEKDISEVLINSLLNYNTQAQRTPEYKKLIDEVNEKADGYFSPDFIGFILREYFFEQKRGISGYSEDVHYMDHIELKEEIGKVLKDGDKEKLNVLKEELLYSFLLGDIVTNKKIRI